jgi:hypothetical protein
VAKIVLGGADSSLYDMDCNVAKIVLGGADSSLYDMDCNLAKITDGLLQDKDCIEKFFRNKKMLQIFYQ